MNPTGKRIKTRTPCCGATKATKSDTLVCPRCSTVFILVAFFKHQPRWRRV